METKKVLMNWRGAPIGARTPDGSPGIGLTRRVGHVLRCGLTAVLMLFAAQGAWATAYGPGFENFSKSVSIDGKLHYSFDVMFFDWGGDNFFWRGQNVKGTGRTMLKVDGKELCSFRDLLSGYYDVGSNDEKVAKNFVEKYNGLVVTKEYNISGTTNVYVSAINPYYDQNGNRSCWITIEIAFERNFTDKQWEIGWQGYWNYNDGGGKQVNETLFTTNKPTVTMPSIIKSNFSRSGNKTIKFNYPSTTTYSGWSNQTILYKSDCTNKWMDPATQAYATLTSNSTEFTVADNYTPVTFYPRFEFYKNANPASAGSGSKVFRFDKDYGAITVPGQPKPKNLQVSSSNSYSKRVTITWERDAYDNTTATDGKWVIFRNNDRLGEVSNGTNTYTDTKGDQDYGTQYTYTVCYQPKNWNVDNYESIPDGLSAYCSCTLQRTFKFTSVKAEPGNKKITLSWAHNALEDASSTKTYKLYVQRSTDDGSTWTDLRIDNINSNQTASGSYVDQQVESYQPYKYRLKIEKVQGIDVASNVVDAALTEGSSLTGFTASRGDYATSVKLAWTVDQVGTVPSLFTLRRRPYGSTNENAWSQIYATSGTATNYSYEDQLAQPGSFNEYKLEIQATYNGKDYKGTSLFTDGFCLATGVVSGRVTYGSGTAVEGAKITLNAINADGAELQSNRSLRFDNTPGQGLLCQMDTTTMKNIFGGDFTIQMWLNPNAANMAEGGNSYVLSIPYFFDVELNKQSDGTLLIKTYIQGNNTWYNGNTIAADKWSHLTFAYSQGKLDMYVTENCSTFSKHYTLSRSTDVTQLASHPWFTISNNGGLSSNGRYAGYIDEFRIFNRKLSADEILKNCNHTLSGSEEGLQVYYPFDEGLENQAIAYDFSRQNGVANGHHATANVAAHTEQYVVPTREQLSMMTYTDKNGNYMLRGIPFSGEGTSYTINPSLGIHRFNPGNESRFFSLNSLTYSGVDFEDVSSFPVSGYVYYDGTTIPVEEAYLYVDGNLASKDGEPVMTNTEGKFTIDVPIGDHFISVKKNGHTFVNGGRYPADNGTGNRALFQGEVKNLPFYDNTRVTVAGRVVGGDIENDKPLGLKQSVANIGKAKLTLSYAGNEKSFINAANTNIGYNASNTKRDFDHATENVQSIAYVEGGKNFVTIETDPVTGEWAAQLLPLKYTVESVRIISDSNITFTTKPTVDATNPLMEYTDSLRTKDDELLEFKYCASAKIRYKSVPVISVAEHPDGGFGEKVVKFFTSTGDKEEVTAYTVDANGHVNYTFGYPIYNELQDYTYLLQVYEPYVNKDSGKAMESQVPLANRTVTVNNHYSTSATILVDGTEYEVKKDTFQLDSLGKAVYTFHAGLPNIQEPYTRGISIGYEDAGTMVSWSQNNTFKAIVLGSLPTGNNFVTEAPDKVLMILRDPPGSGSSATYTKGSSHTDTNTWTGGLSSNTELVSTALLGNQAYVGEGIGAFVINETKQTSELEAGFTLNLSAWKDHSHDVTTTLTRDISTSDSPDYVGSNGDVFIAVSRNRIFGECINVGIDKVVDNDNTFHYEVAKKSVIGMNEEFGTSFMYTAHHIENQLIPTFEDLRNKLLIYNPNPASVTNNTREPIYVTSLKPEDRGYGVSNSDESFWGARAIDPNKQPKNGRVVGPSYHVIMPVNYNDTAFSDKVQHYNNQIANWQYQLYLNEEAKVKAISDRSKYLKDNYSFDAGTSITDTQEDSEHWGDGWSGTEELSIFAGGATGFNFNGIGVLVKFRETVTPSFTEGEYTDSTEGESFSYSFVEEGTDYLSVDVYNAPDDFGPIFYTRAGATSCPYEDEVVTKYCEPGFVLAEKTVQVEKPEIEARTSIISGIPAGGQGTFQVYIRNNSDIRDDIWYNLNVADDSNPDGLIVEMDGVNINRGRSILVTAGETMTKTFTVRQSNPDVMDYRNIKLRIASQCQPDNTGLYPEIADTTTISVFFQPACSDVQLATTHTLVNTDTETPVTLSISGYNHSMQSLQGIRLQYKGQGDADFKTLQEYSKDEDRVAADKNLLLLPALEGTSKLNYVIDLRGDDYSDQTYTFRAVTVCMQGGVEVNNESEEITIVRDMTRPMLIAQPTPSSGILGTGDNLTLTFNEDIQGGILSEPNNFYVVGTLNETEVAHEVALSVGGNAATANTDATIDLSGKSFSTSLWLNYTNPGTLLRHGTADNGFSVAIENGKLVVSIAKKKVVSTATLPTGKWLYLNVSYDATTQTVSAGYAQDASTQTLLSNADLGAYEGNGPVAIGGNGLTANLQELAIWNNSRTMSDAQATMYTTKSQYTNGLLGYWQLNEGHGSVATDKARSRNLTLASQNAWWIAGDNYALTLDGTKAAAANIGALNTTASEDYLIEAWFRADEEQNGTASILGTQMMDLRLNDKGKLELALSGTPAELTSTDLRDGQWHHVAVNVLKSTNGSGIVYVDGQQRKQFAASTMPVLYGDKLMLGSHRTSVDGQGLYTYDQMLRGAIDEVRIWKGRRTADVIKNNMYSRVKADETGLVAYYPMERLALDQYNQPETTVNLTDATEKQAGELSFFTAGDAAATTGEASKANTAALKLAPRMESVQFSFVASERQITVSLTEQPYKLEGCNVYITAKNVKDMHGNAALPITWGVYVQQNNLRWQENSLDVTKEGSSEQTFTATIENKGSESDAWTISGLPAWLSASTEAGTLMPLATQQLTFTVAGSLPIGTYETTVYLTGSQNINAPLNITVTSEGDAPDWTVVPGESTMTVVGVLNIDGVQSSDTKDMVAAFRGTECVGVAYPKYFSRYDSYMILLNIYGKDEADLIYKAYDASTGTVYPSVSISNESANTFLPDKSVGSFNAPVTFTPLNEIEQDLSLNRAGWKWFSLYATPKDADASVVFKDATDAIKAITDGVNTVYQWNGNLRFDNLATMYKLNATEPYVESVIGEPADPTAIDITLNSGWTWIGYPAQAMNSLDAAFADADPQENDMVKNQTSFSIYSDGQWVGDLTAMVPGEGYVYNSTAAATKTFKFPKPAVSGKKNAPRRTANVFNAQCKDNMTMIAVVMDGAEVVENAEVSVYANGELRGQSTETVRDGKHFLTIGGNSDENNMLTFVVSTPEGDYCLTQTDVFQADAVRGSMAQPIVLQLGNATSIEAIDNAALTDNFYDLQGRKVENANMRKGVYISNNKKVVVKK